MIFRNILVILNIALILFLKYIHFYPFLAGEQSLQSYTASEFCAECVQAVPFLSQISYCVYVTWMMNVWLLIVFVYSDPTVSALVESPDNVREFLIKNMSFPPNLADSVLSARANLSKVRGNS